MSSTEKAEVIRAAIDSAKREQYGLYKLRLCLFDVLKGTALDALWIAEKLLPRGGKLDDGSLEIISMLPRWIEAAEDEGLCSIRNEIEITLLIFPRS